jgi:diguanylate cyclase (GGDEF)-like protein
VTTDALADVETTATSAFSIVSALARARSGMPHSETTISAALDAMEVLSPTHFRMIAIAAGNAEQFAVGLGRADLEMRARLARADTMLREGDTAVAGRMGHEVLGWATEHGDAYVLARSHYLLANFMRHVGDLNDALAHAVQCVSRLPDSASRGVRARHISTLAVTLDESGSSYEEGQRRYHEALQMALDDGDYELALQVLNNMAYTEYENNNAEGALALAERMREIQVRQAVPLRAHYLDTIARIELLNDRFAEADETLRPVLDGSGDHLLTEGNALAECLLTAAEAQRRRGDLALSQETLERAARVCDERSLGSQRARVREEQAVLHAARGDYRAAYEEHRRFHADTQALQSAKREARARAMQAAFEIEEARRTSELFREMAQRDPLTGLHNRRFVNERLPQLLRRAADNGAPLSAALLDLDHFKRINDTFSHEAGDAVLERVAAVLAQTEAGPTRADGEPPVVARMGGEEFLLILPDVDASEAMRRCERLRLAIREDGWAPITGTLPVTTSIGLTTVQDGQITPSALLAQADRNLYAAKRSGRDRVVADAA